MMSASCFLYTLVLFSGLSSRSVTAAILEDEGLGLLLGDEPAAAPPVYRRMDVQDSSPRDGRSKIIVVSVSVSFDLLQSRPLRWFIFTRQGDFFDIPDAVPNLITIRHMKYYSRVLSTRRNSES